MAITRRRFVGGGLATGAAVMSGAFSPLSRLTAARPQPPSFLEATIPQLQALMNSGHLTSRDLTAGYLARMASLNPLLGAVIETNPNAIAIAVQRDRERRNGQRSRAAARHSDPRQGQHRHRRQHADDGRLARARQQQSAGRRADRQPAARGGGGDPRQDEPVGVGELPRLRAVQRLERPRRVHPESLPARLRSLRLQLGVRGRAGGEPLRGIGRHRDRRIDRLPVGQQPGRRTEADRWDCCRRTASSRSATARTPPGR